MNNLELNENNFIVLTDSLENSFRYKHYYVIRPTDEFAYGTISFSIETNKSTPFTVNDLRNWFTLTGIFDTVSVDRIGKKKLTASGIGAISNNVPYVVSGLAYYVETQGLIINLTLYAYCNYGSYFSLDESTLNCSCILDLISGTRIL